MLIWTGLTLLVLGEVTSWVVGFVVGAIFAVLSYFFYIVAVAIFGIVVWWLFQPARWQAAFNQFSFLVPLLGFIFLPWTTIMYMIISPGGVVGFDWVWLGLGVFADIVWWAGAGGRRRVPGYTGQ